MNNKYKDFWDTPDNDYLSEKRAERRTQKQSEEDWSTGRWFGAVGDAAWQGARDGIMLDTPETFYRVARTVGDIFGSEDLQHWAGEGINDIKRAREEDPFYKVSDDVMNDYVARSVYGGISSVISSTAAGIPGAAVGAITGGAGFIPMLAGYAFSHGGLFGLAEYDNYIDEAYTKFKEVNPELTWQQVQNEFNSDAMLSALAEGGFEAAGDLIMGGLLGKAGKTVVGKAGEEGLRAWRSATAKTLKGMLITGPLAEVPPELATSAVQAQLRNSSGISTQTVAEAVKETFGSAYVSSMLFGGGGAIAEHTVNAGKRGAEQAEYDQYTQASAEEKKSLIEGYQGNKVIQSLVEGKDQEGFFTAVRDKAVEKLQEQGITDEASYSEMISKEQPRVKVPVNLDPASSEYQIFAKTELKEFGLGYEVPIGKKAQDRVILKTTGELADIYGQFLDGKIQKPEKKQRYWQIGKVFPELARSIESTLGLSADGGYFTFSYSTLEHIKKRHPELSPEEFSLLPAILTGYDKELRIATKRNGKEDKTKEGNTKFILSKLVNNDRYYVCEAISSGKDKRIELVSFYPDSNKKKKPPSNQETKDSMPDSEESSLSSRLSIPKLGSQLHSTGGDSTINNTTDSTVVNNLLGFGDKFVGYLKGERQEITPSEASFFNKVKSDMEHDLENARKLGVVTQVETARFFDLLRANGTPSSISNRDHKGVVQEQWDLSTGKKEYNPEDYDSVNSSLLVPDMENVAFRNERMHALGEHLTKVKDKDRHTTERLMEAGAQAIRNGVANPASLKQYHNAFANSDTAIMALGMMHEQMNRETNYAMFEAEKTGRKEDMAYAMLKMEASNNMTELLSGMGTTAGRALRAMRTIKEKSGQDLTDALSDVLGKKAQEVNAQMLTKIISNLVKLAKPKKGGMTTKIASIQEEVQKILENKKDGGLSDKEWKKINELFSNTDFLSLTAQVKQRTRYQRVRDMVIESTVAGMLTGTTTHIVNTISGVGTIASEIHDRLFSGMMYDKGSVINGKAETKAMLHGLTGFVDAIYAAKTAFWTGQSGFGDQSEKAGQMNSGWSKENLYLMAHGIKNELSREEIEAMGGMGGLSKVVYDSFDLVGKANKKLSTNIMLGSDEFLRTLAYNMQRRALAYREMEKASKLGVGDEKAREVYNAIMDDQKCPPEIHHELVEYTRYLTFQDPINSDSGWKNIDDLRKKHPELMLVMPFLRTPLNIAKWVGTRTPVIANLFTEYKEAMSNEGDMRKKQLAEARMLTGSMIWHSALMLAANGLLTGSGPTDDDEKELLYATGWRPNSLHVNGKYYELGRLDPVATFLSTMASFVEIASDLDHAELSEVAAATMGSALKVASDKYYMSGVSDLLMVFRDSERYGAPYITKMAANMVPFSGARRTAARGLDPVMREARDFVYKVAKDTPLVSQAAAARRTILGEAVKYQNGFLGRTLSPVKTGADNNDPVYGELHRLADNRALNIGKPQRWLRNKEKSFKLNTHQYSRYLELSGIGMKIGGVNAKERLAKLISSSQYGMLDDTQKATVIEKVIRAYRRKAKRQLTVEDSEISEFYGIAKKKRQAEELLAYSGRK